MLSPVSSPPCVLPLLFAAEQADTKPSMRERVGTILHHDEGDNYPGRPYHMERGRHWGGPMHPGPQLTDEQVKEREARRAEWEKNDPGRTSEGTRRKNIPNGVKNA